MRYLLHILSFPFIWYATLKEWQKMIVMFLLTSAGVGLLTYWKLNGII